MHVEVEKLTEDDLLRYCNAATMRFEKESKQPLLSAYKMEHSPVRTQMFRVTMNVPAFVSTHFVRHKIGVEHFVGSNREDLGGNPDAGRHTPTEHVMVCNAAALIAMSKLRLCYKASTETRDAMFAIRRQVALVDPALELMMVPNCIYRNGFCGHRCAGYKKFVEGQFDYYHLLFQ